jgi:hypothetical protein
MKYSIEYCSSGLLYAGCTQAYILNLRPLYRLILTLELRAPKSRTLLSYSCELTWQSSRVCSFGLIQKVQPQTFSKIPAKYPHISNTLTNFVDSFEKRVRPALSLQNAVGAVRTTCFDIQNPDLVPTQCI